MKVTAILSVLIVLALLAFSLLFGLTSTRGSAPRFITNVRTPSSVRSVYYDFLSPRPFDAGRMWIRTDQGSLVFDMDRRQVLGQLTNAEPIMLYGNPPMLLCCQRSTMSATNGLKKRFLVFLEKLSGGRIKIPFSMPGLTYWILDLHNTATRLGDIPGNPFTFHPSPDLHFSFTTRDKQNSMNITEIYLLELRRPSMQKLEVSGWPCDWWDTNRILLQTTNRDFVLYDVQKRAMAPLISLGKVAAFFQETGISGSPLQIGAFAIWNGRENNFYLTDTLKKWEANESFLVKVERPDGKLKLISPRFKFEWSDHLDPTERYYSFSGREQGEGSDGVFFRDLDTGTNRVLVAPTTNAYFSIPRFYRDSIFYIRSNAFWLIGLDGSRNSRLFPPPTAQERTR